MQQYPLEKHYWEQTQSERALPMFRKDIIRLKRMLTDNKDMSSGEKFKIRKKLTVQFNKMKLIGDLEARTKRIRTDNKVMDEREERWKKHNSTRLGLNMRLAGKARPDANCQAHAIVAGADPLAAAMRAMLIVVGIWIDDAINGVWLPNYEINHPHWAMKNAVCHTWLNYDGYHLWLHNDIFTSSFVSDIKISDEKIVIKKLKSTANLLRYRKEEIPGKALRSKADTAAKNKVSKYKHGKIV